MENNKHSSNYPARLMIDTGAQSSVIHEHLLAGKSFRRTRPRKMNYRAANGKPMLLWPHYVEFFVKIPTAGIIKVTDCAVSMGPPNGDILLGRTDMARIGMVVDYAAPIPSVTFGRNGICLPMMKSLQFAVNEATTNMVQPTDRYIQWWKQTPPKETETETGAEAAPSSISAHLGDGQCRDTQCRPDKQCCSNDQGFPNDPQELFTKLQDLSKEDAALYFRREIDIRRQRLREKTTQADVTISDELRRSDPELTQWIENELETSRQIFSLQTGYVGKQYDVNVNIKEGPTTQRAGHNKMTKMQNLALHNQAVSHIANGVLIDCNRHNIKPLGTMQILVVEKKEDDGSPIALYKACRLVQDCTNVNLRTDYVGSETDNLQDKLDFAAKASTTIYNMKGDFSSCYDCVGLKEELWPYFSTTFDLLGTYCFTRCVQGWAPSGQEVAKVLSKIFYSIRHNMRKYMDDLLLAANDRNEFKQVLRTFFRIMIRNNLRLKGKKVIIGSREFNYLGFFVKQGKIMASEHYVDKIRNFGRKDIVTVKQLSTLVGMIGYIARFMKRSQDFLQPLRLLYHGKQPADRITWTDDGLNDLNRALRALNELVTNYAFDATLQTVMVVDTSKYGTGGFLYQIKDGRPRIIRMFHRVRKPSEKSTILSSCHIELAGLAACTTAFWNYLEEAQQYNPITVLTDSRGIVLLWKKLRQNQHPGTDMVINRFLYDLRQLRANIIHSSGTAGKLNFADILSRDYLDLVGHNQRIPCDSNNVDCPVCKAANADVFSGAFSKDVRSLCQTNLNMIRTNNWIGSDDGYSSPSAFMIDGDAFAMAVRTDIPNIRDLRKRNYSLISFLRDHHTLLQLQMRCPTIRNVRKALLQSTVQFSKHHQRENTILKTKSPRINDDGILVWTKFDSCGKTFEVIPLPVEGAWIGVVAVHNSNPCGSTHQLQLRVERLFVVSQSKQSKHVSLKEMAKKLTESCSQCFMYKQSQDYIRDKMKPIAPPKDLFTQISVDEITRTCGKKTYAALVAMEVVSKFMFVYPYEGKMNSEKFIAAMAMVKTVLAPHSLHWAKIELRMDQVSYHTSHETKSTLADMNFDLISGPSASLSKNIIPELDGKLKSFSRHLNVQMFNEMTQWIVATQIATHICNNTISSATNKTPSEIYTQRRWIDGSSVVIDAGSLIQRIKEVRQQARDHRDRRNAQLRQQKQLQLVPYDDPDLNHPFVRNPDLTGLKPGDHVKLKETFDKNQLQPVYLVLRIDWKKELLLVRKLTPTGRGHQIQIRFSIISHVLRRPTINMINPNIRTKIHDDRNHQNPFLTRVLQQLAKDLASRPTKNTTPIVIKPGFDTKAEYGTIHDDDEPTDSIPAPIDAPDSRKYKESTMAPAAPQIVSLPINIRANITQEIAEMEQQQHLRQQQALYEDLRRQQALPEDLRRQCLQQSLPPTHQQLEMPWSGLQPSPTSVSIDTPLSPPSPSPFTRDHLPPTSPARGTQILPKQQMTSWITRPDGQNTRSGAKPFTDFEKVDRQIEQMNKQNREIAEALARHDKATPAIDPLADLDNMDYLDNSAAAGNVGDNTSKQDLAATPPPPKQNIPTSTFTPDRKIATKATKTPTSSYESQYSQKSMRMATKAKQLKSASPGIKPKKNLSKSSPGPKPKRTQSKPNTPTGSKSVKTPTNLHEPEDDTPTSSPKTKSMETRSGSRNRRGDHTPPVSYTHQLKR